MSRAAAEARRGLIGFLLGVALGMIVRLFVRPEDRAARPEA